MKAKYKLTGETVDVEPAGTWNSQVALYQTKDGRRFPMYALEFEKDIDWEERRFNLASKLMIERLSCTEWEEEEIDSSIRFAVLGADALIAELKKENEYESDADH